MAPRVTYVTGVAGSGKTRFGVEIAAQKLRDGLRWDQIAFCSFSKAACAEAASRISDMCGVRVDTLTKNGFYRTLHSAALRCLGISGKLILDHDSVDGKKFLKEHLGAERGGERGTLGERVDLALSWWDTSRATLQTLDSECLHIQNGCVADHQKHRGLCLHIPSLDLPQCAAPVDNSCAIGERECTSMSTPATHCHTSATHKQMPCAQAFHQSTVRENEILLHTHVRTRGNPVLDLESVSTHEKCLSRAGVGARWLTDFWIPIVIAYERAKKFEGRLDYSDILMKFAGYSADEQLRITQGYADGTVPDGILCAIIDEAQDCSRLLWSAADRLTEASQDVYKLGDPFQCVYSFGGADGALFEAQERLARDEGNAILLNRSHRNTMPVIGWGESVLAECDEYESREPWSELDGGSVGLIGVSEFIGLIGELANSDVMVIGRTEWNIRMVRKRLDEVGVPWKSTQEKFSSRWDSPARIAFVLVMRDLAAGKRISEQDWRRVTQDLNQKWNGVELFERGVKARWNKLECSQEIAKTLDDLAGWGAKSAFQDFVREGKWKVDMPLLIDRAIDKFGIECVRNPRIKVGTVHSVKGLQARNVFCMAGSTERCQEGDPREERCLKYVAITRSSLNYRLVVDTNDVSRGKPLFWAAPKGYWTFLKGVDDVGVVEDVVEVDEMKDDFVPAAAAAEPVGDDYEWFDL